MGSLGRVPADAVRGQVGDDVVAEIPHAATDLDVGDAASALSVLGEGIDCRLDDPSYLRCGGDGRNVPKTEVWHLHVPF